MDDIQKKVQATIDHYQSNPERFWEGTKDHDVTQNYQALLETIHGPAPYKILDFGCGPGRDLKAFKEMGHHPIGLDACESFCQMAKDYSGCEILQQNFLELNLEESFFDGIFANASLFHVPKKYLKDVLKKLHISLKTKGVFFSSNPRGNGESIVGTRYANYMQLEEYQKMVESCGFELVKHYYRPKGIPVAERPWLACVFSKMK